MEIENNPIVDRSNYLSREPEPMKQVPLKGDIASLAKKVFAKREENGKRYYLVQWKGSSISEATWESSDKLGGIMNMIIDFEVEERWKQEHCKNLILMNEKRHADQELSDDEGPKKFSKGEKGPQRIQTNHDNSIKIEPSAEISEDINNEESSDNIQKNNNMRALLQHQANKNLDTGMKARKSDPREQSFEKEKERNQSLQVEESSSSYIPSEKSSTPKKCGPGRPRKSETQDHQDENLHKSDEKYKPFTVIRTPIGRGRPKKDTFYAKFAELRRQARAQQPHVIRLSEKGKRLGRPPKPVDEQKIVEKRPLGRPRKDSSERITPKRSGKGRGRPRKNSSERITPKRSGRGRGRPRKDGEPNNRNNEEEASNSEEEEGNENIEYDEAEEYSEESESDASKVSESEEVSDEHPENKEDENIGNEKRRRGRPRKILESSEEEEEVEDLFQEQRDIAREQPIFSDLEEDRDFETKSGIGE